MNQHIIALTAGDVAGIGPEVLVRALASDDVASVCLPLVICHPQIIEQAIAYCGLTSSLSVCVLPDEPTSIDQLRSVLTNAVEQQQVVVWNPCDSEVVTAPKSRVSAAAGNAAFHYLLAAIRLAQSETVAAVCTAPLNKAALHAAGHHYPGHTEILAERCGVSEFAMMLHLPETQLGGIRNLIQGTDGQGVQHGDILHGISIAHVTLHTSVRSVPELLSCTAIQEKIRLMNHFLTQIGCGRRSIGVCALNPHGGEQGLFGHEEADVIEPAVKAVADDLPNVSGPFPVDTLIRRAVLGEFDGVVAMYHDQGHIPIKLIGFDAAVNITLGLPIIRTSPTHGTAFDRAWNSATPASASGMIEAILAAAILSENRHSAG